MSEIHNDPDAAFKVKELPVRDSPEQVKFFAAQSAGDAARDRAGLEAAIEGLKRDNTALREQLERVRDERGRAESQWRAKYSAAEARIAELSCSASEAQKEAEQLKRDLASARVIAIGAEAQHKQEIAQLKEKLRARNDLLTKLKSLVP